MLSTAAAVARLLDATLEGDPSVEIRGVEVDSRRVEAGDLFVALPGVRRDGHEFVGQALERGAAALVSRDAGLPAPPAGRALLRVENTLVAYHRLAAGERTRRPWWVVGLTGSVGKTTTKEILAALLATRFPTGASEGNRNSTLGLPAELLSQPPEVEVFVAEMGMSHPGELDTLGRIVRPHVLLYTRIAPAHTEFFPDMDSVVRAKAELLPHLEEGGVLVLNAADPHQESFAAPQASRTLTYGTPAADVHARSVEDRGLLGSRFTLVMDGEEAPVELPLAGAHQVENLLAAAAAASALGLTAAEVAAVAPALEAPPRRGRILHPAQDVRLVDDSYNSSPEALRRMLELLGATPGRRVAVLGEMYELGKLSEEAHAAAGRLAASSCDVLVAVGGQDAMNLAMAALASERPPSAVHRVGGVEEALGVVRGLLRPGDVILVKGSRGVELDRLVDALLDGGGS